MRLRISDADPLSVEDRTQIAGPIEQGRADNSLAVQEHDTNWDPLGAPAHASFSPSVALGDEGFAAQIRAVLSALTHEQNTHRLLQRIVVTGVNMKDRARIVAASLATVCANSGYRVLLIDADFNRPSFHHMFGVSNRLGLSTLLSSPDAPHHLPQATSIPNLAVICAGPSVQNYSSLIAREQVFHRLQPLARSFDYMIIDAGSLAPAQVARLSAGADNVVVTVEEHVSSLRDLANMVQILQAEGVPHPAVLMVE